MYYNFFLSHETLFDDDMTFNAHKYLRNTKIMCLCTHIFRMMQQKRILPQKKLFNISFEFYTCVRQVAKQKKSAGDGPKIYHA